MFGFVNGLAIIIFMAQIKQFKVGISEIAPWMTGAPLFTMVGLVILTIILIMELLSASLFLFIMVYSIIKN